MPKYDYKEIDELTSMDDDWPHDPAVPELPPIPDALNSPPPEDNFNWLHFQDDNHPQKAPFPTPLTEIVNEEKPQKADVSWSELAFSPGAGPSVAFFEKPWLSRYVSRAVKASSLATLVFRSFSALD